MRKVVLALCTFALVACGSEENHPLPCPDGGASRPADGEPLRCAVEPDSVYSLSLVALPAPDPPCDGFLKDLTRAETVGFDVETCDGVVTRSWLGVVLHGAAWNLACLVLVDPTRETATALCTAGCAALNRSCLVLLGGSATRLF